MPTARTAAASAALDGMIYVIGGLDSQGNTLDTVERYDPASDSWSTVASLDRDRANAAAVVFEGQLYVLGGHRFSSEDHRRKSISEVEVFDALSDRWESFASLEKERDGLEAVVLQGLLYAVGGADDDGRALSTSEFYDASEDKWVLDDNPGQSWVLDIGRASFASAVVSGAAFTFGGFGSFSGPVSQTEKYEPNTGTSILEPFVTPRGGLASATVGKIVFIMGGRRQDDAVSARVDRYMTTSGAWDTSAPMNTAREDLTSSVVDNTIYVFGGSDDRGNVLGTVERFGPVSVATEEPGVPSDFSLGAAYPNPFSANVSIELEVSADADSRHVSLVVFDALGREVRRLVDGSYPVGRHTIVWNGTNAVGSPVTPGSYLYRFVQGRHIETRTLVFIRR